MNLTLTESRLIKMWTATDFGGDWYELNKTLWHIAKVLEAEGNAEAADTFEFLAAVAMWRAILEITERKASLKVARDTTYQDAIACGEALIAMGGSTTGSAA